MTKKQVSILLVEDDEIDVMGIKRAFKEAKVANPIIVAENGLEALEKLKDGKSILRPYLILLDINMPRMNGHEFLEEIRADEDLKNSIVFVLTTSKDDKDVFKAYEKNVAGYLIKENIGKGFLEAVSLLDTYWKIVEFP